MTGHPQGDKSPHLILDREAEHTLRNHIAVIVGTIELILEDCQPGDPRAQDLAEIHKAATAAMHLLQRHGK